MKTRSLEPEILDELNTPAKDIESSLDFMVGVNRWLGGTRAVLEYFEKNFTGDRCTVLDLGTGSGDIPFALAEWGRAKGKTVSVTALDLNPACLEYAGRRYGSPYVRYVRPSAFDFAALGAVGYVISSMFFHHLGDDQIVALLRNIDAHARRGFIVNDLERGKLAHAGAVLLTLGLPAIVRNDAPQSVARGFKTADFERYVREAGLSGVRVERKPVFRVVMSRGIY